MARKVLEWATTKPSKRVTALLVALAVLVGFSVIQVEQAHASTLPHGIDASCGLAFFHHALPYNHCHALAQPGTTADINEYLGVQGASFTGLAAGLAAALCTPGGPVVIALCTFLVIFYAAEVIAAFHKATAQHRCAEITWVSPSYGSVKNLHAFATGKPQHWGVHWTQFNGHPTEYWVWENQDSCQTRTAHKCPGITTTFVMPPRCDSVA